MAANHRVVERIIAGPSKYDLLILGFGEARIVEFTFGNRGKHSVEIISMTRDRRQADRWVIQGEILHFVNQRPMMAFEAEYTTVNRGGEARINETCLTCGNQTWFGWFNGVLGQNCSTCEPLLVPDEEEDSRLSG